MVTRRRTAAGNLKKIENIAPSRLLLLPLTAYGRPTRECSTRNQHPTAPPAPSSSTHPHPTPVRPSLSLKEGGQQSFKTSRSPPSPLPATKRRRTLSVSEVALLEPALPSPPQPAPGRPHPNAPATPGQLSDDSIPPTLFVRTVPVVPIEQIPGPYNENESVQSMDDLSNSSSASYANSWISWFLASKGNEYFCEVDDEYINDRFNLTGLNAEVQGYNGALELITDTAPDEELNDEQRDQLEASARHLYGLIHARFIITSRGLTKMIEKYKKGDFGRCPRVLCYGQALLPLGLSDVAYQKAVKLYCPRCEDLYSPKSSRHGAIDGAYFGSTFAHMLFMVYPALIPAKSVAGPGTVGQGQGGQPGGLASGVASKVERIRPRIFGFRVHEAARLQRWQEGVRDKQIVRLENYERNALQD